MLLRAGMVRKSAAGIYSFLPLGWRSLHKIEQIVREEMDAHRLAGDADAGVQPAELWHESGRWDALRPGARCASRTVTAESSASGPPTRRSSRRSCATRCARYRELPLSLYQIQVKFRDEVRPRFGLLRGREFIMKDAYSFHARRSRCRSTTTR